MPISGRFCRLNESGGGDHKIALHLSWTRAPLQRFTQSRREMLRRRRHAQAQASGEAEGRWQEEDAPVWEGPAGGVHRGAEGGCVKTASAAKYASDFNIYSPLAHAHRQNKRTHAPDSPRAQVCRLEPENSSYTRHAGRAGSLFPLLSRNRCAILFDPAHC